MTYEEEAAQLSASLGRKVFAQVSRGQPTSYDKHRAKIELQKKAVRASLANKRRAAKLQRTPAWANLEAIQAVYRVAAEKNQDSPGYFHVDHIYPLQGKLVSGLHVHNNLRIISAFENGSKSNSFDVE